MSALAACFHKAEWLCRKCAKCPQCCQCDVDPLDLVHCNSKEAAQSLGRAARESAKKN